MTHREFNVTVPPTPDVGSFKCHASESIYESKEDSALSQYNSARAHDGLAPLKRMPTGTKYHEIHEG